MTFSMDDPEASLARRFLLGQLPPNEAEQFETRLLEDAEVFEMAQAIEDDLVDDYVRGRLSGEERAVLAARFANRPDRIRFAEALARRTSWQMPARRILTWAAAAAILLVAGGALWWRQVNAIPGIQVPVRASRQTTTSPPPAPARQVEHASVFTIVLATTRDAKPSSPVELDPGTTRVELAIRIHPADLYPSYDVMLSHTDGTAVWSGRASAPTMNEIRVTIPASAFALGDYQVAVAGLDSRGSREDLGEQTLTVRAHAKSP